jgi:energy-coupling factor transporter ATP-binding protein EcfA2
MELKFIWIEEYKNIKKTGFNFNHSVEEEFQFIDDEIIINPKLNCTPKKFFNDNITGLTAIVGKNGSGKTNLTEFINYNLAHATNGGLSTYITSRGITIVDKWIFVQNDILINNEDYLNKLGYNILKYENAPLDDDHGEMGWHNMEKNKYIYYNPTFDLRGIPVRDNLVNISTTMLVYNDLKNSEKLRSYSDSEKTNFNQLDAFATMEKSRICDFVLNFEKANKYIEFLPEKIKIAIDTKKNNYFLKKRYFYGEEINISNYKDINTLQNELDNLESFQLSRYNYEKYFIRQKEHSVLRYHNVPISEQKNIFYRLFFINIFQGLLNKGVLFPSDYFRRFIYNEIQDNQLEDLQIQEIILKLKVEILKTIENADWTEFDFPLPEDKYDKVDVRTNNIYEYLGSFVISISENKTLINKVISLINSLLDNKSIFSYEPINEFSSGQNHILTLYSRFFWAKRKILESEIGLYGVQGESIIVFIDEGEVALHPEWQRTFFHKVINYLSDLFKEKKIQLIITTHSPFVLSDIPKENVIFLDRNENGNSQISNLEKENTFGANIYSLLSDSFFMKNTIGAFAEKKMKWALEILKSGHNDYSIDEINELNYIIDSIGEPIIKEQFEYLFNIKFGNDEVADLKKTIIDLKKQLKKEEDDSDKN